MGRSGERPRRPGFTAWTARQNQPTAEDLENELEQLEREVDDELAPGQNVAVYFDDDFYIGQVVSIETPQVGDIKFMDKCGLETNVYKWPRSEVTENIASMFVFSWDFELSTSNGRMWQLGEYTSVSKKYELYKELFC